MSGSQPQLETEQLSWSCDKKNSLRQAALSAFDIITSEPFFKVGIWLEVFFRNLTVFQNCLLPWLDILFRWSLLDCRNILTTWFLSVRYFFHTEGHPVSLPFLQAIFLFLIFALICLFIHGRLRLGEIVALGMHCSIIAMNLSSHMLHSVSMSDSLSKKVQSFSMINVLALSKSAWEYLRTFRFRVLTGDGFRNRFNMKWIPLWSELPNGGITLQDTSWEGAERGTRSIRVELPEGLIWVGWGTTCVNTKPCKKLDNLQNNGWF